MVVVRSVRRFLLLTLYSLSPAGGDDSLFNSPVTFVDRSAEQEQEQESSEVPPYVRLT